MPTDRRLVWRIEASGGVEIGAATNTRDTFAADERGGASAIVDPTDGYVSAVADAMRQAPPTDDDFVPLMQSSIEPLPQCLHAA